MNQEKNQHRNQKKNSQRDYQKKRVRNHLRNCLRNSLQLQYPAAGGLKASKFSSTLFQMRDETQSSFSNRALTGPARGGCDIKPTSSSQLQPRSWPVVVAVASHELHASSGDVTSSGMAGKYWGCRSMSFRLPYVPLLGAGVRPSRSKEEKQKEEGCQCEIRYIHALKMCLLLSFYLFVLVGDKLLFCCIHAHVLIQIHLYIHTLYIHAHI